MTTPIHFKNEDSYLAKVFQLLSDKEWHCRECEGKNIGSGQYAGGGGIKGLDRGTKSRDGLVIEQRNEYCPTCQKQTKWDRWTGETKPANSAANIPQKLVIKILEEYKYIDAIEQRKREKHELIIDHRFPMERWGQVEQPHTQHITSQEIRKKFQLLKKDDSGNHNLLKSRACERCIKERKRGTPFGINYWYEGNEDWNILDQQGSNAEQGCIGCGWYDFEKWRTSLNQTLKTALENQLNSK